MRTSNGRRHRWASIPGVVVALVLAASTLTSCGGDDPQADYCAAGEALQTSLTSLTDLDVIAVGTDGLREAFTQVRDDMSEVRSTASDAVADDVGALDDALAGLDTALSDLGGELTSENADAVRAALDDVRAASRGVLDTLADC